MLTRQDTRSKLVTNRVRTMKSQHRAVAETHINNKGQDDATFSQTKVVINIQTAFCHFIS